jgi:thiamine biosynthesis lipoprotein
LDGIAKGYIVDVGIAKLQSLGYANVYVEAGGDLRTIGTKPDQAPWKIGLQSPRDNTNILMKFDVSNQAVATSGDYMRYFSPDMSHHHIIDPRVGISPTELASVTILSTWAALSDAFATAVMVMGIEAGLDQINKIPDMEALLVTKDNQLYQSVGFGT